VTRFNCNHVFGAETTQAEVSDEISQLTQSAIDGYKVCIFAYGQTGSGKTHTMIGGSDDERGVIPRAAELIFRRCSELKSLGWKFEIHVQCLQVYKEELSDLLPPNKGEKKHEKELLVRDDGNIHGLVNRRVGCVADVEQCLETARKGRVVRGHKVNATSSRSHYLFRMNIAGEHAGTRQKTDGQLNLVDLAGSERIKETGVDSMGKAEAVAINQSLTSLTTVIAAMAAKKKDARVAVPFRNSKLTHLLRASLSGSGKMLMFVNVSPLASHLDETYCSMRFAMAAGGVERGEAHK
jgi:kinesin family protein C1